MPRTVPAVRSALPFGVFCALLLVLPACTSDDSGGATDAPADTTAAAPAVSATPGFAPRLEVDLDNSTRLPSGVYYRDITVGTGAEAVTGSRVAVNYGGWLADGTFFDGSVNHDNQPLPFTIGTGEMIAAWDEGVAGMRVGGRRQLVIPPEMGYGAEGRPPVIPPNATLVFTIDLLGVQGADAAPAPAP